MAKLATHDKLRQYVQDRLAGMMNTADGATVLGPNVPWNGRRHGRRKDRRWATSWSPEQISQRLRIDFPDDESMRVVSRLGLPLINEALIGIQDKDRCNRSRPTTDVAHFGAYFLNPVLVRDGEAGGIYSALGVPQSTVDSLKSNRTDILDAINLKSLGYNIPLSSTGDVLRVATNVDSKFPNGRQIPGAGPNHEQVDVTDAILTRGGDQRIIPWHTSAHST